MSRMSSSGLVGRSLSESSGPRPSTTWQRPTWGPWTSTAGEMGARRWRPWIFLALLVLLTLLWRLPFGARAGDATAPPAGPPVAVEGDVPTSIGESGGGGPTGSEPGALAVGAVGAAGERDSGPEPLAPTIGADGIARPTVRILAPEPGTLVTGTVWVRWESAASAPIEATEIHVDGRQIVRLIDERSEKKLDMRYFDGGDHVIEVMVYDGNRRKGSDQRTIRVRNPTFALQRVNRKSRMVRNGEELVIELVTNGTGFALRADLEAIDSALDEKAIEWTEIEPGHWQLTYRLSEENQRPDGSYWMAVTLEDKEEPSIHETEHVRVELDNQARGSGLREVFEMHCGVYRPDPVPPAGRESPRLLRVEGASEARVGEPLRLRLVWDGAPGRSSRFLRLSADGFAGHFVLHGKCGLEDTLEIVPKAVTDEPLHLAIWPSEGLPVVHYLSVAPAL